MYQAELAGSGDAVTATLVATIGPADAAPPVAAMNG
jgi:hypothetical protein